MRITPSHDEIKQAIQASNFDIDVEKALANPVVAKCLELMVIDMREQKHKADLEMVVTQYKATTRLVKKLRKMIGNSDFQALQANMKEE